MAHSAAPPFAHSSGPKTAAIAIVGEAWGSDEEACGGIPFIGASGQELTRMFKAVGIKREDCFLTNVLALRPPSNDIAALCDTKTAVKKLCPKAAAMPPLTKGKYLLPEYLSELERLRQELEALSNLTVIVALGATAAWAVLGTNAIGSIRGTVAMSTLVPRAKVLATYHPAHVLRQWNVRPIVLKDLTKALAQSAFHGLRQPEHNITVATSLQAIGDFLWEAGHAGLMAVDVETKLGQITCLGFGISPIRAFVVPFHDPSKDGGSYWPSATVEAAAWSLCKAILDLPCEKVFQNGLYDLQYLALYGIKPRTCAHDTMLLHHSIYPELQKGLGFLGSIYCDLPAWKLMNPHHQKATAAADAKADE